MQDKEAACQLKQKQITQMRQLCPERAVEAKSSSIILQNLLNQLRVVEKQSD